MLTFLIALVTGVVAGALTARAILRHELDNLRAAAAAAVRASVPAPSLAQPAPALVAAAPAPAPGGAGLQPGIAASAPGGAAPAPGGAGLQPGIAATAPKPPEELTPEILTVLSAAVAAFLGKRAKIRAVRFRSGPSPSSAWAQQGRVFVQASHNLPVHH